MKRPELYVEQSNKFELEKLGCEIGDVFASASNDIWTPSVLTTMASLSETVAKLRHENPGLVKAKQFFVEGISDPNDLPQWLQCLAFAEKMNYTALQHDLADQILDGVFCLVSSGLMDYEKGMKLLLRLFPKLLHWTSVDRVCRHLAEHRLIEIIEILNDECSEAFRNACEKALFSNEYVSEDNELVQAAREAFQATAGFSS
ncbi:hypothetical protein MP638_007558 [Amoeboaphelidium occidentale]|nr:hypothetical protein MP638_007558 [Amoeboaphelidium occidentale]